MHKSDRLQDTAVGSKDRRTRHPEDNSEDRRPAAGAGTLCVGRWAWPMPGTTYRQKARSLLIAALSLCFSLPMSPALRAQDLAWAKRAGGTGVDLGRGIGVDGSGNSYVTGRFRDPATFGPGETNETTLTSAGIFDIFVAKYVGSGGPVDTDGDSVPDSSDLCPGTAGGAPVDAVGCSDPQVDGDGDGAGDVCDPDDDNDGIPDELDQCADSDQAPTVVIDGCDSGVPNTLLGNGCSFSDLIADLVAGATNPGGFTSAVAHLMNDLKQAGIITGQQEGTIQSCAGGAAIP